MDSYGVKPLVLWFSYSNSLNEHWMSSPLIVPNGPSGDPGQLGAGPSRYIYEN